MLTAAAAAAASGGGPATPLPVQLFARAAVIVAAMWTSVRRTLAAKLAAAAEATNQLDAEEVNSQIKGSVRTARRLMIVAPFAALSNSSVHTLLLITRAVSSFIKLYLLLLFMRVLLSWFPAFNWEDQPWLALRQVTDPYLNLFRGLVPPLLGSIDFTPLFGFMILQFLAGVLEIQDEDTDVW